jgi:hypothetical protein
MPLQRRPSDIAGRGCDGACLGDQRSLGYLCEPVGARGLGWGERFIGAGEDEQAGPRRWDPQGCSVVDFPVGATVG